MLYAELGPGTVGVSGSSVAFGCFRLQQPCRCSAGAHRAQAAQPAAGSRCSCGAGGHGARAAAAPLSECETGQHGGRAAGATERKRPARCCGGGRAWVGCRGSQRQRRGCRNSEGVAAPGALAGAAALCIVLYLGVVLQLCFSSKCPFFQPSPARRCDRGSTYPMGQPLAACCSCRGAPRGLSRLLHAVQGQRLPGGGAAANYHPPHRVSGGGCRGGAFPSPVCVGRSNEKRGRACKALPLVAFKGRPGDGRSGLGLSPAPTG